MSENQNTQFGNGYDSVSGVETITGRERARKPLLSAVSLLLLLQADALQLTLSPILSRIRSSSAL